MVCYVDLHLSALSVAGFPHHVGKGIAVPLAPKTAKESMNKITWLPPSRAADIK
jgi:hypothetical protein